MMPLTLKFKGARRYLHGTDIFDAIMAQCNVTPPLFMQLRSVIRHQISVDDLSTIRDRTCLVGTFRHADGTLALMEDRARPIVESYPYDEDAVCGGAAVTDGRICSEIPAQYTFIEAVVALHKRLMRAELPKVGEWWFVQIALDDDLRNAEQLELRPKRPLVPRLAVSEIWAGGLRQGTIGFSERNPQGSGS